MPQLPASFQFFVLSMMYVILFFNNSFNSNKPTTTKRTNYSFFLDRPILFYCVANLLSFAFLLISRYQRKKKSYTLTTKRKNLYIDLKTLS